MARPIRFLFTAFLLVASSAAAADHCGIKQAKDGTLYVKASHESRRILNAVATW